MFHDHALGAIRRFWMYVEALVVPPFQIADKARLTRRLCLVATLWLGWVCFAWARDFVNQHPTTAGLEAAAIIGAVTAPMSLVMGWMFKVYTGDNASPPPSGGAP
jgi:hypothetical protein